MKFKPIEPKSGKQIGCSVIRLCCLDGRNVNVHIKKGALSAFLFDLNFDDFVIDIRRIEQRKILSPYKYLSFSKYEGLTVQSGTKNLVVQSLSAEELKDFLDYANDFITEVKEHRREKIA